MLSKITDVAKIFMGKYLDDESICIDATLGNGYDSEYLTKKAKYVYAFDIQKKAIETSKKRIQNQNIKYILDGHENVDQYINKKIDLAVFNLGYLPKSNKKIITKKDTTIKAIKKISKLLKKGKAVIICSYYGHDGGLEEKNAVEDFLKGLKQTEFITAKYNLINRENNPPILYLIEKVK